MSVDAGVLWALLIIGLIIAVVVTGYAIYAAALGSGNSADLPPPPQSPQVTHHFELHPVPVQ